jgi:hypothetical protein
MSSGLLVALPAAMKRSRGRLAGLAAIGSVACWLLALQFANAKASAGGTVLPSPTGQLPRLDRAHQLLTFHAGQTDQELATACRCIGLLLTAVTAMYLYSLVRSRNPQVRRWMLVCGVAGAASVAGATVFGFFALRHVANAFVASGPRTTARAAHLIDGSGPLHVAAVLDLLSRIVFAAWVGIATVQMMRVELLDRFMGYWGLGACISLVLLPIGDAMFIAWLGSIGIIALGYWPGGRPAGWRQAATDAGHAR